jgi:hypothetical protein
MKNYIFLLFVVLFSFSLAAQDIPSVKSVKKSAEKAVVENKDVDEQISTALLKDEGLQREAFNFLKSNPDTKSSFASLLSKNKSSSSDLIKSVLGNKDLATAAINYIKDNPKLLEKAMKIVGL